MAAAYFDNSVGLYLFFVFLLNLSVNEIINWKLYHGFNRR